MKWSAHWEDSEDRELSTADRILELRIMSKLLSKVPIAKILIGGEVVKVNPSLFEVQGTHGDFL